MNRLNHMKLLIFSHIRPSEKVTLISWSLLRYLVISLPVSNLISENRPNNAVGYCYNFCLPRMLLFCSWLDPQFCPNLHCLVGFSFDYLKVFPIFLLLKTSRLLCIFLSLDFYQEKEKS